MYMLRCNSHVRSTSKCATFITPTVPLRLPLMFRSMTSAVARANFIAVPIRCSISFAIKRAKSYAPIPAIAPIFPGPFTLPRRYDDPSAARSLLRGPPFNLPSSRRSFALLMMNFQSRWILSTSRGSSPRSPLTAARCPVVHCRIFPGSFAPLKCSTVSTESSEGSSLLLMRIV